jgi:hypothetical protein
MDDTLAPRHEAFLRAEVSHHQRRQGRYRAEAQQMAQASADQAATLQAAGMKPTDARAEFATLYAEVINGLLG